MADEYGCFEVTKSDARAVREALNERGACVFPISGDKAGAMIILVTSRFEVLGTMPFGGNPRNRFFISVYGRGCNHFSGLHTEPGYFAEKLNISVEEAQWLSEFWDMIWMNHDG